MQKGETDNKEKEAERAPVIVIMGHVDHGKSTLLDYIRKTSVAQKEIGGITQHTYAYEIIHRDQEGKGRAITFLDTPGHQAFSLMRERGANVADIAVLVVAGDDGVKEQTVEALDIIKKHGIPFIIAITKIDREGANAEKVKQGLAEHDVFVEGYGGQIPVVPISSKTGAGIQELLNMMLLVADLEELRGNPNKDAEGFIIESHRDPKRGISGTLLIKDGVLKKGTYVAAAESLSPVRKIENFLGEQVPEASFSSPVQITGWNTVPAVGAPFRAFALKKDAEHYAREKEAVMKKSTGEGRTPRVATGDPAETETATIPLVVKADTLGTLEAVLQEVGKMRPERVFLKVLNASVGDISESDVKSAASEKNSGANTFIVGFNVNVGERAQALGDRYGLTIKTFDIIYQLTEWLLKESAARTPKILVNELVGRAKLLKIFSNAKNKHVVGGKVLEGKLVAGKTIKILRRNSEIDVGKILGLEQQKKKVQEVPDGLEFGALIETKHQPAPGDTIETFALVER